MSGNVFAAAAATVALSKSGGLPYVNLDTGDETCPSCHNKEYTVFMAEKGLVECSNCGRVYPVESAANNQLEEEMCVNVSNRVRTVWIFGLSGAGKTTFAKELITSMRMPYLHLDGDVLRQSVCADLGYSLEDRLENVRRVANICSLCNGQDISCVVSMITPTQNMRQIARNLIGADKFRLIYLSTPLDVCSARDNKGLYAQNADCLTGVHQTFEPLGEDEDASLILSTATSSMSDLVTLARGYVRKEDL